MGYNIGLRLIEDYLAKSNTMRRCSNFRETAEMIAKVLLLSSGDQGKKLTIPGGIQDIPQHHSYNYELDER
jgi:hypothetical protein